MCYIASSGDAANINNNFYNINSLNLIIAVIGALSCMLAIIFTIILKK